MFFLQMSGFPGSGKSTLAREIAKQTKAVLVDHDVVKSAFLKEITDLDPRAAGKTSYNIDWAIIDSNLAIGNNVILDSPCLYQEMIEKGERLAKKYNAKYKYVECYLDDIQEINHRLKTRIKMPSQIDRIDSEAAFKRTLANSKKPLQYPFLRVDTSLPLETYLQQVMNYINE